MKNKVPFLVAIMAVFYAIFRPNKFAAFQKNYTEPLGISAADNDSAVILFHAFWLSLLLVLTSALAGSLVGLFLRSVFGLASSATVYLLQATGAATLLWGTLFIRGWEIQTYSGQTLIERINQWIYRSLYFFGTAVFMSSLTWSLE